MLIKELLNTLKETVSIIVEGNSEERKINYLKIKSLLDELRKEGEEKQISMANFNEYATHLLWHCGAIAGVKDDHGHDERQHLVWAYAEINKLESSHCFNI